MSEVNLSQLLDRKSFTVLYTLFHNRYRVTTTVLADSGTNAFAPLDTKCIKKISEFLNTSIETLKKLISVKGYNGQIGTPIVSVLQTHFQINRQRQYNMPFLITDLGSHNVILGCKWLVYLNLWLDICNQRLIWPADLPPTLIFVKETIVDIKTLQGSTINLAHQANAICRDQAFQEEDLQAGKIKVLKQTQENTISTVQLSTVEPTRDKLWTLEHTD
jgi:hypothetical protein